MPHFLVELFGFVQEGHPKPTALSGLCYRPAQQSRESHYKKPVIAGNVKFVVVADFGPADLGAPRQSRLANTQKLTLPKSKRLLYETTLLHRICRESLVGGWYGESSGGR